jgi:8-oxo-dGTP diphosphatase
MKNFPVIKDGKEYWVSRSVAVVGIVFCKINGEIHVLANRRGRGAADFQGLWNVPCGYVDYDETLKGAVRREVYEECGVDIPESKFNLAEYNDNPNENRQNISVRFIAVLDSKSDNISVGTGINNRGGEKNEVEAIQWIPIKEIDNLDWAFNHKDLISEKFKFYKECLLV